MMNDLEFFDEIVCIMTPKVYEAATKQPQMPSDKMISARICDIAWTLMIERSKVRAKCADVNDSDC